MNHFRDLTSHRLASRPPYLAREQAAIDPVGLLK
jgi:hypothetical protein